MSLAARGRRVVSRGRFSIAEPTCCRPPLRTRSRITFDIIRQKTRPQPAGVALNISARAYCVSVLSEVMSDVPAESVGVLAEVVSVIVPVVDVVSPVVVDVVSPVVVDVVSPV